MKKLKYTTCIFLLVTVVFSFWNCEEGKSNAFDQEAYKTWETVGGTNENIKYSSLSQIDTSNVADLEVAWEYHSEDPDAEINATLEINPLIIGDTLYGVSPNFKLFALDAATGDEKWVFDSADSIDNPHWHRKSQNVLRGVSYWSEGQDERIIFIAGSIAYEIDAKTGELITSFGEEGGIDLTKGLDRDSDNLFVNVTSPVVVYEDLFFVGGLVGGGTPGHIRAYNVKTGKREWIFHTIPHPGEEGYETWEDTTAYKTMGGANSWAGFSLDEERGILYAPTAVAGNDFYGGKRWGDNLFSSSLVALDAKTGALKWNFQTIHHDVWDHDVSSPPALATIKRNGEKIDAAILTTKLGYVYVFDRETGDPVFPIEEKEVPTDYAVPGEKLSPTQPHSSLSFGRQKLTIEDLNPYVSEDEYKELEEQFKQYNYEGKYTPPTEEGTLIFPGYDGGGEWGGPTVDPTTGMMYVNSNQMAWLLKLIPEGNEEKKIETNLEAGEALYETNCAACHGTDLEGGGEDSQYPSLIGVDNRYSMKNFESLLKSGRGMMPGFPELEEEDKKALASYILDLENLQDEKYAGNLSQEQDEEMDDQLKSNLDYSFNGYKKFQTEDGMPAISPPWGMLTAIDLSSGEKVWEIPFGEDEELKKKGIENTGTENYGGSVVTAGGLLFIGATRDKKFRAFNKRTGELLFETELPASASATPAVYEINGKEYIVIASGGSKFDKEKGDVYTAFALPDSVTTTD